MCDPVTALVVISSAYGLNEQRKSAKRNERFYKESAAEQQKQIFAKRSGQADDRNRRARSERARLRALSAETGLGGISSASVLRNVDFRAGSDVARIQSNLGFDTTNSQFQLQSNLNQIQQPDYIGTALNAGLQLARVDAAKTTASDPNSP